MNESPRNNQKHAAIARSHLWGVAVAHADIFSCGEILSPHDENVKRLAFCEVFMRISLDLDVKLSVMMGGAEVALDSLPAPMRQAIIGQVIDRYLSPKADDADVFTPPILPIPIASPPRVKVSDTWIVRACNAIGKPATATDIYSQMVSMGFESKAEEPVKSVYRDLSRYTDRFVRIKSEGRSLWTVRKDPSAQEHTVLSPQPQSVEVAKKDAREYAFEILKAAGKPLDTNTLADMMFAAGWPNSSPTAPKRRKAAHVALWRYKDEFAFADGKWRLVEWGKPERDLMDFDLQIAPQEATRERISPEELARKEEAFLASRQN